MALFHVADAAQTVLAGFVLRAYRIATVPLLIYAVAIWGIGLGGGDTIAFNTTGWGPLPLQGAQGFRLAAAAGLVIAASGVSAFLAWLLRQQRIQ